MFLGKSVVNWIILIVIAICVFIVIKWLIPLLFGMLGVTVPDLIATALALLVALGVLWGGYGWRGTGGPAGPA